MNSVDEFDFSDCAVPTRRAKPSGGNSILWIGISVLGLVATAGGIWFLTQPVELRFAAISDQKVDELEPLVVRTKVYAKGVANGEWKYELITGPSGAEVDPSTGVFNWTPTEEQGPFEYEVNIRAKANGNERVRDDVSFKVTVEEANQKPFMPEIEPVRARPKTFVLLMLKAKDEDKPAQKLKYELIDGPTGATLDPNSGKFAWKPDEADEGSSVTVRASVSDGVKGSTTYFSFVINIDEVTDSAKRLLAKIQDDGVRVETRKAEAPDHFTGRSLQYSLDDQPLTILVYPSVAAAKKESSSVSADGRMVLGHEVTWKAKTYLFQRDNMIVLFDGESEHVLAAIREQLGAPFVVVEASL